MQFYDYSLSIYRRLPRVHSELQPQRGSTEKSWPASEEHCRWRSAGCILGVSARATAMRAAIDAPGEPLLRSAALRALGAILSSARGRFNFSMQPREARRAVALAVLATMEVSASRC